MWPIRINVCSRVGYDKRSSSSVEQHPPFVVGRRALPVDMGSVGAPQEVFVCGADCAWAVQNGELGFATKFLLVAGSLCGERSLEYVESFSNMFWGWLEYIGTVDDLKLLV